MCECVCDCACVDNHLFCKFSLIYRVVFLTVPTQNFLSTRKKQSIRTVPTQKFLSVEKSRYCQGISHYSFILFLHMRELSPEKCELVNIWKYCKGGNSSGTLTFFFVYSGWEQFGYFNFFLSYLFFRVGTVLRIGLNLLTG